MQLAFSVFFLVFSFVFTIMSFRFDFITNSGGPGAGFFPVLVGIAFILVSGYRCLQDFKQRKNQAEMQVYVKDLLWVVLWIVFLVVTMFYLGALLSMALFIFALLFTFNRTRLLQNIITSITIPILIFVMFDVWLNAGLPKGILDLF